MVINYFIYLRLVIVGTLFIMPAIIMQMLKPAGALDTIEWFPGESITCTSGRTGMLYLNYKESGFSYRCNGGKWRIVADTSSYMTTIKELNK